MVCFDGLAWAAFQNPVEKQITMYIIGKTVNKHEETSASKGDL